MKAHLLFADGDLDLEAPEPADASDLVDDLELATLLRAMAGGDELVGTVARAVLLHPLRDPDAVVYRQHVLDDCLHAPEAVRALYDLAGEAIAGERGVFRGFFAERPESMLFRSVRVLQVFLDSLKKLRTFAVQNSQALRSTGFAQFFDMVRAELDDAYFAEIEAHLKQLQFRNGLLLSARLGEGSQSVDFVLRQPRQENRTFFNRIGLKKPTFSYTVPDRDEAGHNALAELRDRGLREVASAAAQSADHVLSFFTALRAELAFYLGCVNLRDALAARNARICFPTLEPVGSGIFAAQGVYDVCLQLQIDQPVVTNTFDAHGCKLVMITGANQGGKSTFLRSVGLAHLMSGAGMFAAAQEFHTSARTSIATHFKREEDNTMTSGKFDEELARMSGLADRLTRGGLLLCNESFQSTNEREGSEIGRQVIDAMTGAGVTVVFVTHLYDLSSGFYAEREQVPALFLRADRDDQGRRPFRLVAAEPLPTSYGQDVYARIIGTGNPPTGQPAAESGVPDAIVGRFGAT